MISSPPDAGTWTFIFFLVSFLLYFLPSFTAYRRKQYNKQAILVLNLLLGWTLIGWVVALVWAYTSPRRAEV